MEIIAKMRTGFKEKFGIPRQSGMVSSYTGKIVFEEGYRNPDLIRGLEDFSHIWVIWLFSENEKNGWNPTVRPPRLGGNERKGVFATRSPFRPNPIGLSCLEIANIEYEPVMSITVIGPDMADNTPILDIKPYIPYADCKPEAKGGFAKEKPEKLRETYIPPETAKLIPENLIPEIREILEYDPRPPYHSDPEREYTFSYSGMDISFKVDGDRAYVTGVRLL